MKQEMKRYSLAISRSRFCDELICSYIGNGEDFPRDIDKLSKRLHKEFMEASDNLSKAMKKEDK